VLKLVPGQRGGVEAGPHQKIFLAFIVGHPGDSFGCLHVVFLYGGLAVWVFPFGLLSESDQGR